MSGIELESMDPDSMRDALRAMYVHADGEDAEVQSIIYEKADGSYSDEIPLAEAWELAEAGTITEDYLGRINICEFCGEEVIPNGNTRSVRALDPQSRDPNPPTLEVAEFTAYACCPPGHTRYIHSQGFCCCSSMSAPQDCIEPMWRRGGDILTEFRGRSRPSRHLASQTPGRDAKEQKRIQLGPEYPIHRLSNRQHDSHRYLTSNRPAPAKPQSTATASFLMG